MTELLIKEEIKAWGAPLNKISYIRWKLKLYAMTPTLELQLVSKIRWRRWCPV